jgi:hypothetical protein
MIFLLYKRIISLGPCFAPVSDVGQMFSVALTAQANTSTECLNRIYRLSIAMRISRANQISPAGRIDSLLSLVPCAFQPKFRWHLRHTHSI